MLKTILMFVMKPTILVGGQAVIEGVMMRVPGGYATAARDPEGSNISIKKTFGDKLKTMSGKQYVAEAVG